MAPKLYWILESAPCRAVQAIAAIVGLPLDYEILDLNKGQHLQSDFLKINPQHTVPTLIDDDGFTLWDSHAIMPYLIARYAKNDDLYPKDIKTRAIIDQRLHFDSGVLWAKGLLLLRPLIYDGQKIIPQSSIDPILDAYGFLDKFLEGRQWMAGDSITIADYSLIATVASLSIDELVPVDAQKFPRLTDWIRRTSQLPEFHVIKEGVFHFQKLIRACL